MENLTTTGSGVWRHKSDIGKLSPQSFYRSDSTQGLESYVVLSSCQIEEATVACKLCSSDNQSTFKTEMNFHFSGRDGWVKPSVWAFPEILVCLDCGFSEFVVAETELRALADENSS